MLLRVSSYKRALVKHQINKFCQSKQTAIYVKKIEVWQVGTAVSFMLCLVQLFSLNQEGNKSTNHSKLNGSTCAGFTSLIKLDNCQKEVDPKTCHRLRRSCLWLCHKKVAVVLNYTFIGIARFLDLPLYKCKTEKALKVPLWIPYWFTSIICYKRSTQWPIFEAGFGEITNSWAISTGLEM